MGINFDIYVGQIPDNLKLVSYDAVTYFFRQDNWIFCWSIGVMEYCNANLYSNTPVLQNPILFNPVYPVRFLDPTAIFYIQVSSIHS
jgi:hypothetical protein